MEKYKYYTNFYKVVLLILDILLINIAYNVAYLLRLGSLELDQTYQIFFVVFVLVWWVVTGISESNRLNGHTTYGEVLRQMAGAWFMHAAVGLGLIVAFKLFDVPRLFLLYAYAGSLALTVGVRCLIILIYKYYKELDIAYNKYVIVGAGAAGEALYDYFESHKSMGYKCLGIFDHPSEVSPAVRERGLPLRGTLDDVKRFCLREQVSEIYYARPLQDRASVDALAEFADDNFIHFKMVPEFAGLGHRNVNLVFYDSVPVLMLRREPLEIIFNRILKRSFDVAFSLGVLLFIFPFLYLIIGGLIKLTSPGPILFKQLRPGRRNQLFECYKFRTMRVNTATELQATKNDARITPIGAFLRKTSLDEFPQFINVLRGEMSIVGPRPNLVKHLEEYSDSIRKYGVRHFVTPGITGYAQVNGYRGETRHADQMAKRVEYDVAYMENWSFLLDLKIIWLTVWNVIRGEKNAY